MDVFSRVRSFNNLFRHTESSVPPSRRHGRKLVIMVKAAVFSFLFLVATAAPFQDKSIVQWLEDDGNFTVLVNLLKATGLDGPLKGTGPYTVFAPDDGAFSRVPAATFKELQADGNKLKAVLQYHVSNGFLLNAQISDGMIENTLQGESLVINKQNGNLRVEGANVTNGEQILNNGVVYRIDTVLLPSLTSVRDVLLQRQNQFGDLLLLLTITDLLPALSGGSITLFAPTNGAFDAISAGLPSFASPSAKQIYAELLKSHVVSGTFLSTDLKNGMQLQTLHNNTLTVSTTGGVVLNPSGARVTTPDITGFNGVVHAIDTVIIPTDLQIA